MRSFSWYRLLPFVTFKIFYMHKTQRERNKGNRSPFIFYNWSIQWLSLAEFCYMTVSIP